MTEKKLPMAGEWWKTRDGHRVYVTTVLPDWCLTSFPIYGLRNTYGDSQDEFTRSGRYTDAAHDNPDDLVEHLPWCKSFDDTEPVAEVWPKYYETNNPGHAAYIRRDDADNVTIVRTDGREWLSDQWSYYYDGRRELPESEALARLTTKCPDCGELAGEGHADVCPMAWVTQDRVPVRLCDEINWTRYEDQWFAVLQQGDVFLNKMIHGHVTHKDDARGVLSVRCRRKDLPPLPEPVKETCRIPLRVFVPRRVIDDPSTDWPIRVSRGEVWDVATWVEVHGLNVYVEVTEPQSSP